MANEYKRPTTVSGAATWTNIGNAYDGTGTSDNSTYSSATAGDKTEVWSDFGTTTETYTALTLHVVWEFVGTPVNDYFELEYSLDGGNNWETPIHTGQPSPTSKTDWNTSLSTSQDLSLIQVRAFLDKRSGPDAGIEARIWETYTDGEYTESAGDDEFGIADLTTAFTMPTPIGERDRHTSADFTSAFTMPTPVGTVITSHYGLCSLTSTSTIDVYETIEYDMGDIREAQFGIFDKTTTSTLFADGTVTGASGADRFGIADLISAFTLDAIAERDRHGSISLTSTSTMDVYETIEYDMSDIREAVFGIFDKSSTFTLFADAFIDSASFEFGVADLASVSTLDAIGERDRETSISLTSASTIGGIGERDRETSVSLTSTSTIGVVSSVDMEASIGLTSTSTLDAVSSVDKEASIGLTSTSTLGAIAHADNHFSASLTSTSILGISAWVAKNDYASAGLDSTLLPHLLQLQHLMLLVKEIEKHQLTLFQHLF